VINWTEINWTERRLQAATGLHVQAVKYSGVLRLWRDSSSLRVGWTRFLPVLRWRWIYKHVYKRSGVWSSLTVLARWFSPLDRVRRLWIAVFKHSLVVGVTNGIISEYNCPNSELARMNGSGWWSPPMRAVRVKCDTCFELRSRVTIKIYP
jgi:hypothetical protein